MGKKKIITNKNNRSSTSQPTPALSRSNIRLITPQVAQPLKKSIKETPKKSHSSENAQSQSGVQEQSQQKGYYLVDKILKKRVVDGKVQLLVSWKGYSKFCNRWIDKESFMGLEQPQQEKQESQSEKGEVYQEKKQDQEQQKEMSGQYEVEHNPGPLKDAELVSVDAQEYIDEKSEEEKKKNPEEVPAQKVQRQDKQKNKEDCNEKNESKKKDKNIKTPKHNVVNVQEQPINLEQYEIKLPEGSKSKKEQSPNQPIEIIDENKVIQLEKEKKMDIEEDDENKNISIQIAQKNEEKASEQINLQRMQEDEEAMEKYNDHIDVDLQSIRSSINYDLNDHYSPKQYQSSLSQPDKQDFEDKTSECNIFELPSMQRIYNLYKDSTQEELAILKKFYYPQYVAYLEYEEKKQRMQMKWKQKQQEFEQKQNQSMSYSHEKRKESPNKKKNDQRTKKQVDKENKQVSQKDEKNIEMRWKQIKLDQIIPDQIISDHKSPPAKAKSKPVATAEIKYQTRLKSNGITYKSTTNITNKYIELD